MIVLCFLINYQITSTKIVKEKHYASNIKNSILYGFILCFDLKIVLLASRFFLQ